MFLCVAISTEDFTFICLSIEAFHTKVQSTGTEFERFSAWINVMKAKSLEAFVVSASDTTSSKLFY